MIQFPKTRRRGSFQNDYFKYHRAFLSIYGPDSTPNTDREVGDWSKPFWIRNENWHADFERQRILFKDQAVMSMILLKITV